MEGSVANSFVVTSGQLVTGPLIVGTGNAFTVTVRALGEAAMHSKLFA
jgi:hypothetical protein